VCDVRGCRNYYRRGEASDVIIGPLRLLSINQLFLITYMTSRIGVTLHSFTRDTSSLSSHFFSIWNDPMLSFKVTIQREMIMLCQLIRSGLIVRCPHTDVHIAPYYFFMMAAAKLVVPLLL